MAFYVIMFDDGKVINVTRYSEAEYEDYMLHIARLEKSSTVLHQGYKYNGKPYYVTVEDAIYSAKVNAGWDRAQVQEALNNLIR